MAGEITEQTSEEQQFELPEATEKETGETSEEVLDLSNALPQEVELAKKHGFKVGEEDGEQQEQSESKTDEDTEKEAEEDKGETEEKEVDKTPTFDEAEKDESLTDKYNPNEKALYWKWKNDKRKRQDAVKELDELKAGRDLNTIKDNVNSRKLQAITDALGKDDLTVEQLQAIINNQQGDAEGDNTPITRADLKKMEDQRKADATKKNEVQLKRNERIQSTEEFGKIKHTNFDGIVKAAQEVIDGNKDGTYAEILESAIDNEGLSEEELVEKVITIAKLNPNYKELTTSVKAEDKDNVNRAIKNSKKKVSSAALGKSGGKRIVNENELTPDDAVGMSTDQWLKLKPATKKRLMGG